MDVRFVGRILSVGCFNLQDVTQGLDKGEVEEKVIGEKKSRKWGPNCGVDHVFIYQSRDWGDMITIRPFKTH